MGWKPLYLHRIPMLSLDRKIDIILISAPSDLKNPKAALDTRKHLPGSSSVSQPNSSEPSMQSGSPSQRQCFVTHSPSLHLNHSSGLHWGSNPWAAPLRKRNMEHDHAMPNRSKRRPRRALNFGFLKTPEEKRSYFLEKFWKVKNRVYFMSLAILVDGRWNKKTIFFDDCFWIFRPFGKSPNRVQPVQSSINEFESTKNTVLS